MKLKRISLSVALTLAGALGLHAYPFYIQWSGPVDPAPTTSESNTFTAASWTLGANGSGYLVMDGADTTVSANIAGDMTISANNLGGVTGNAFTLTLAKAAHLTVGGTLYVGQTNIAGHTASGAIDIYGGSTLTVAGETYLGFHQLAYPSGESVVTASLKIGSDSSALLGSTVHVARGTNASGALANYGNMTINSSLSAAFNNATAQVTLAGNTTVAGGLQFGWHNGGTLSATFSGNTTVGAASTIGGGTQMTAVTFASGTTRFNNALEVGADTGSTTVTISSGTLSANSLTLTNGSGTLNFLVQGGTVSVTNDLDIFLGSASTNQVNVSGGKLLVGGNMLSTYGTGMVSFTVGGMAEVSVSGSAYFGGVSNSSGLFSITGGRFDAGNIYMADGFAGAHATFSNTGGYLHSADEFVMGSAVNAVAVGTVSGIGSRLVADGNLTMGGGSGSSAVLTVSGGSGLQAGALTVGGGTNSSATLSLNGATATLGSVQVGSAGAGVVSISNATVSVADSFTIGTANGSGTVSLGSGGVLSLSSMLMQGQGGVFAMSAGTLSNTGATVISSAGSSSSAEFNMTGGTATLGGVILGDQYAGSTVHAYMRLDGGSIYAGDVTLFDDVANGGNVTLQVRGATAQFNTLRAAEALVLNSGSLTLLNGGSFGKHVVLGNNTVSSMGLTLQGGTTSAAAFYVGDSGLADLTISQNATATLGALSVGEHAAGNGSVVVAGTLSITGSSTIGNVGTGAFTVADGATVTASDIRVGNTGTGTLTVAQGGTLTANNVTVSSQSNLMMKGGSARFNTLHMNRLFAMDAGDLTLLNGGSLASSLMVAAAGSTANVTIAGGTFTAESVFVGDGGTGSFTLQDSSATLTANFRLGVYGTSAGAATLSNASLSVGGDLYVGIAGAGTLAVATGSRLTVTGTSTVGASSTGSMAVTGATVSLQDVVVNNGSLQINEGSLFTANNVTATGANSALIFDGGASTLNTLTASNEVVVNHASLTLSNGGSLSTLSAGNNTNLSSVNLTGGTLTTSQVNVGTGGMAALSLASGATLSAQTLQVGQNTGTGALSVAGNLYAYTLNMGSADSTGSLTISGGNVDVFSTLNASAGNSTVSLLSGTLAAHTATFGSNALFDMRGGYAEFTSLYRAGSLSIAGGQMKVLDIATITGQLLLGTAVGQSASVALTDETDMVVYGLIVGAGGDGVIYQDGDMLVRGDAQVGQVGSGHFIQTGYTQITGSLTIGGGSAANTGSLSITDGSLSVLGNTYLQTGSNGIVMTGGRAGLATVSMTAPSTSIQANGGTLTIGRLTATQVNNTLNVSGGTVAIRSLSANGSNLLLNKGTLNIIGDASVSNGLSVGILSGEQMTANFTAGTTTITSGLYVGVTGGIGHVNVQGAIMNLDLLTLGFMGASQGNLTLSSGQLNVVGLTSVGNAGDASLKLLGGSADMGSVEIGGNGELVVSSALTSAEMITLTVASGGTMTLLPDAYAAGLTAPIITIDELSLDVAGDYTIDMQNFSMVGDTIQLILLSVNSALGDSLLANWDIINLDALYDSGLGAYWDGTNLVVDITRIPEPSVAAALLGVCALVLVSRRRR